VSGVAAPLALLAAVVLGDSQAAVDCKIGQGLIERYVPNRLLARPKPQFADNRADVVARIQGLFGGAEMSVREVGSGTLVFDSPAINTRDTRFLGPGGLRHPRFEFIERDPYIIPHAKKPDDEYFHASLTPLWGLHHIKASDAWDVSTGSTEVVVAVVDGGIYFDHEDLDNPWTSSTQVDACPPGTNGYDAIADKCVIMVSGSHGTQMAGAIGALGNNNTKGVVGVNWNVGLMSVTFMENGIGCAGAAANALSFVRRVVEEKAGPVRVVNLSWGSTTDTDTIRTELEELAKKEIVLVASAGNSGRDIDQQAAAVYPAAYNIDTLIGVANYTPRHKLASGSNYGKTSVHIAAPGTDIMTTWTDPARPYKYDAGTSIAAAHVSGAIALLASKCSCLNGKELKDLLLDNCAKNLLPKDKVRDGCGLRLDTAMTECAKRCTHTP
jgi:subtilisin family serine protease